MNPATSQKSLHRLSTRPPHQAIAIPPQSIGQCRRGAGVAWWRWWLPGEKQEKKHGKDMVYYYFMIIYVIFT